MTVGPLKPDSTDTIERNPTYVDTAPPLPKPQPISGNAWDHHRQLRSNSLLILQMGIAPGSGCSLYIDTESISNKVTQGKAITLENPGDFSQNKQQQQQHRRLSFELPGHGSAGGSAMLSLVRA